MRSNSKHFKQTLYDSEENATVSFAGFWKVGVIYDWYIITQNICACGCVSVSYISNPNWVVSNRSSNSMPDEGIMVGNLGHVHLKASLTHEEKSWIPKLNNQIQEAHFI
jgi:hypothetical protein